jgi:hypothetical protein
MPPVSNISVKQSSMPLELIYNAKINKIKAIEKLFELCPNPIVIKTADVCMIRDG